MSRPLVTIGRRLPHGWNDLLLQLGLFFFAYQGYQLVRGLVDAQAALAFDNAAQVAPPRMLTGEGFVDTLASFASFDQDSNAFSLLVNEYAAVPSMHIGFALMIAGAAFAIVVNRTVRLLWFLYPLLVFAVVLVTANHYWFAAAAAAAAVAAAISALVAHRLLAPVHPAWSFRRTRGEAIA